MANTQTAKQTLTPEYETRMLELIKSNPFSYLDVEPELRNTKDFTRKAIEANPGSYHLIQNDDIKRTLQDDYKKSYLTHVMHDALEKRPLDIEREFWKKNEPNILRLATRDMSIEDNARSLKVIEERYPEYTHKVDKVQEKCKAWDEQRINGKIEPENDNIQLQNQWALNRMVEIRMKEEKAREELRLSPNSPEKKQEVERIEKEKETLMVYIKASAISQAYDLASIGEISYSFAINAAEYVGNVNNYVRDGAAMEAIARTQDAKDKVFDHVDDRDLNLDEMAIDGNEIDLDGDGMIETLEEEYDGLDEISEDDRYEQDFAGNPFVSYEPEEGLTQTYH